MSERSKTALDTSFIIAALQTWHESHQPARARLDEALKSHEELLLPVRALVESYSVMTRLPGSHRVDPDDAASLLEKNFARSTQLIDLPAEEYWRFLRDFVDRGIVGGACYDAEIIECALRAGADQILTLNGRDFKRLAPEGIQIVVPGEGE